MVRAVSSTSPVSPPRAWAEIDLDALRGNLAVARAASGGAIMAVVKASAYGHGLEEVARVLAAENVAFFGVANIGEARRLREAGIATSVYLLGATWAAERPEVVARGITPCISALDEARAFNALAAASGTRLKVHLAVDTGMGRGGFLEADLPEVAPALAELAWLEIEGIGSHLSSADEDDAHTRRQIAAFAAAIAALGGPQRFRWRHLNNSAGILGYPNPLCNLARPGLMLYGVSPLAGDATPLLPVMTLKSRVTLVRTLPSGHGVSYGRTFVTTQPTRVATIGIGYADGYPRDLSGQGAEVAIRGRRFPLIGRVTMDQIMADVTSDPTIAEGDEVELFGRNVPVAEIAAKAGTIAWDVLTGITSRVQRVQINQ